MRSVSMYFAESISLKHKQKSQSVHAVTPTYLCMSKGSRDFSPLSSISKPVSLGENIVNSIKKAT